MNIILLHSQTPEINLESLTWQDHLQDSQIILIVSLIVWILFLIFNNMKRIKNNNFYYLTGFGLLNIVFSITLISYSIASLILSTAGFSLLIYSIIKDKVIIKTNE